MSWKIRTSVGMLTAAVVTGAGVATMANALASAQPPAPSVSVATTTPTALAGELPADQLRTERLARSVDGLLAQIGVLEKAVAAGSATATHGSTAQSGRAGSAAGPTATSTTAEPQGDGRAPTEQPSETPEPPEPFHD